MSSPALVTELFDLDPPELQRGSTSRATGTKEGPAIGRTERETAPPPAHARSVAVLPFANLSPDPENEYFSDGITEEILTALSRVSGLRIPARTSSFAFKGTNADREIAGKLEVAHLLEGSVRRAGSRVRITAQLVEAAKGYHLWSQSYHCELADVFAIQDEIAQPIAAALELRLRRAGLRRSTGSLRAHDLYLLGLYHWNRREADHLLAAIDHFERATREDPGYALAYAGLALGQMLLPMYQGTPTHDAIQSYGQVLLVTGLLEESAKEYGHAAELDPLALPCRLSYPYWARFARRYDEATVGFDRILRMEPDCSIALYWSGFAHPSASRFGKAEVAWRRRAELGGLRDPAEMEAVVAGWADPGCAGSAGPASASMTAYMGVELLLDPVRSDPRYTRVAREVGLR